MNLMFKMYGLMYVFFLWLVSKNSPMRTYTFGLSLT